MPFLALVHLRELRCAECDENLAAPGARSFIVDDVGDAVPFAEDQDPEGMTVSIVCSDGHENQLYVPNDVAAEDVAQTPDDAPIGRDAVIRTQK